MKRAEVAGERAGAAVCADERVERDLADAQIPAPERLQSPLDLVELEQAVAAAGLQSRHLEVNRTTGVRQDSIRRTPGLELGPDRLTPPEHPRQAMDRGPQRRRVAEDAGARGECPRWAGAAKRARLRFQHWNRRRPRW